MAKSVGIVGAMSGKAGNIVFTNQGGRQVASVHRPEKKVSYTPAQLKTRFRFTMARAISHVFPSWLLEGLGGNIAKRRAKFEQMLNKAVWVAETENGLLASIQSPRIILSKGDTTKMFMLYRNVMARWVTFDRDGVSFDAPVLQMEFVATNRNLNLYYVCLVVSRDGATPPKLSVYHAVSWAAHESITFSHRFDDLVEPTPHEREAYFWVVPFLADLGREEDKGGDIEGNAQLETIEKRVARYQKKIFGWSWVPIDEV